MYIFNIKNDLYEPICKLENALSALTALEVEIYFR